MRKHFGKWLMLILSGVFLFFVMGCAAESSGGSSDGGSSSKSITVTYVDESGNVLDSEEKDLWNSTINITLDYKKTGYISIVAAARKLAELMYTLLKNGTSYEKRASASVKQLAAEALATAS